MSAIAHGWKPSGLDIPVKVAKEFHAADKGHKYGAGQHKGKARGGDVTPDVYYEGEVDPSHGGTMVKPLQQRGVVPDQWYDPNKPVPQDIEKTIPPVPLPRERAFGGVAPRLPNLPMSQTGIRGLSGASMMPPLSLPGVGINRMGAARKPFKQGGDADGAPSPAKVTTGPLLSSVPGRTDKHFAHVPSGAYVIPADIVSGLGQGNTLAGINHLHNFFRMGPGSTTNPVAAQAKIRAMAKGGSDKHVGKPVPVKLAGGEIVVPPENVHETMQRTNKKKMTLDEAHRAMDAWVVNHRKKLRRTLAKLPGPARD